MPATKTRSEYARVFNGAILLLIEQKDKQTSILKSAHAIPLYIRFFLPVPYCYLA